MAARLAALPGVAAVHTRVVKDVTLDVPGLPEPATGRLVSVPVPRRPILNDLVVRRGGWPGAPGEVLVSEAAAMLLGEQALLTLAALPLGFAAGRLLCLLITLRFSSELFRIPLVIQRSTYLFAAAVVVLAAAASSALVRLRIDRLDLVEALKARE